MAKKDYFKSMRKIMPLCNVKNRVINIAKEKNWVETGNFVVVTFGDVEGVSGKTNSLKIVKA